jgi:DNA mismatch repair protein MutS
MDPVSERPRWPLSASGMARLRSPMTFQSILCRRIRPDVSFEQVEAPEFFHDLNIDQIVAGVTGKDEYDLKPFFYRQLADVDEIAYRQQVMKDLECPRLSEPIGEFA